MHAIIDPCTEECERPRYREPLLKALEDYEDEIEQVRAAIESGDAAALRRLFARARGARARWLLERR